MTTIWNYWLVTAFIAPMLWALVNIIDVYFVGEVFEDEFDGTTISGLFQFLPWVLVLFQPFDFPSLKISLMAMLSGLLFLIAFFFYFKSLFTTNDVSLIGILWNFSVFLLPIVAFFLIGEKLLPIHYLGIAISFIGGILISFDEKIKERNLLKVFYLMMGAVSFLIISMILSEKVYNEVNFFDGFLMFSLGGFIGGLIFAFLRLKFSKSKVAILKLEKKYFFGFFVAEFLSLLGTFFSQRTIDLSPAVSFVVAIESLQPFFILVFSVIIFIILSLVNKKNKEIVKLIYKDQLVGYKMKILASIVIAIGIYLINV